MLPLRNTIAYPFVVLPLVIGIPRSIKLIEDALEGDRLIGLLAMKDPSIAEPQPDQIYTTGTVAMVSQVNRTSSKTLQVVVQGIERFKKVLAAHRAGLTTVILPKRNERDLDELPDEVRSEMTFLPVERIDEALKAALKPCKATTIGRKPDVDEIGHTETPDASIKKEQPQPEMGFH